MVKALPVIEAINDIISEKPIFQVVMPLPEFWQEYRTESKTKRALFRRPEDPAIVINNLLKFQNKKSNNGRIKSDESTKDFKLDEKLGRFLSSNEVTELCDHYKLPLIKDEILSLDHLMKKHINFPVVLKAVGEKIIHKTDLKGVVLNIKTKDELIKIAEEMIWNFSSKNIQLDKFLVQPFLKTKYELLVGAFRDPSFGPMIMFGTGGKYVEYIDDTIMRSAYLTEYDIDELINSTKIGKIIQGVRGEVSADLDSIKLSIKNLAQMMLNHKEITEVDLNPLLVSSENKIFAVDVRIKC
jgi:acetyltransferase